MMRFILLYLMVLFCVGCRIQTDFTDLDHFITQSYENSQSETNFFMQQSKYEPVNFSPKINKDPFLALSWNKPIRTLKNCLQPKKIPELELFNDQDLSSLVFKGIIREGEEFWALVMAKNSQLARIAKGQVIGANRGLVESIDGKRILVTEYVSDDTGCWQKHRIAMAMQS